MSNKTLSSVSVQAPRGETLSLGDLRKLIDLASLAGLTHDSCKILAIQSLIPPGVSRLSVVEA